jgi:hypothetical protein
MPTVRGVCCALVDAAFTCPIHADEGTSYRDHVSGGRVEDRDTTHERAGHLHSCLRGLDLDNHLVDLDVVPNIHAPRDDLGFSEAFAKVGQ